jgi:DNA-binding transcriptional LysR family regulator
LEYLSWDLSILARAVAYANLSSAASNVGISQPQLSRIVAKLEEQLGLVLLDRETRRKSSWTPAAYKLAELYTKTFRSFRADVDALAGGLTPHELHVGTLEGLTDLAIGFCRGVLDHTKVMVVQLDVLDTHDLEERFAKGSLDLILTAREAAPKQLRHARTLGYQSIDRGSKAGLKVHSAFEYATMQHKDAPTEKAFVSNSLRVRLDWMAKYGGAGTMPSAVRPKPSAKGGDVAVIALAHDSLSQGFWDEIVKYLPKA